MYVYVPFNFTFLGFYERYLGPIVGVLLFSSAIIIIAHIIVVILIQKKKISPSIGMQPWMGISCPMRTTEIPISTSGSKYAHDIK